MGAPALIADIGMGASAAGGILGAFGAAQKGSAAQAMYNYQSGLAQMRSQIDLQNRDYALQVGEEQSARYGIAAREKIGATRAAQGASNIDVGSGSSVLVRQSEHNIAALDMTTIRNNAARRAYGYEVESATDTAQAGMYKVAGAQAKKASEFDVASSLISGASSVSSKWLQGQSAGIWSS